MHSVMVTLHFSYAHRVLNYPGKCGHLHGHNAKVEVLLERERLNHAGMVKDFSEVKGILGRWLDALYDHKVILAQGDPLASVLHSAGEPVVELDGPPTAEVLARTIFARAKFEGLPVVAVHFWETDSACASYRERECASS